MKYCIHLGPPRKIAALLDQLLRCSDFSTPWCCAVLCVWRRRTWERQRGSSKGGLTLRFETLFCMGFNMKNLDQFMDHKEMVGNRLEGLSIRLLITVVAPYFWPMHSRVYRCLSATNHDSIAFLTHTNTQEGKLVRRELCFKQQIIKVYSARGVHNTMWGSTTG